MTPAKFPEANVLFGKPEDWDDTQCGAMVGFRGNIQNGNLDGQPVIVTAWQPTLDDIDRIIHGSPIYLVICGEVLPPHALTTEFPR